MAIDSATGRGIPKENADSADIPGDQTLESTARTLGMALGIPKASLDKRIDRGKVITAALIES